MADKGRDLKVSILSDADRFNLAAPADDLERLGEAAGDTARDLDDLGDAGRNLDDLGRSARDAGRDLEDVSRSSSDLDQVGKDAKGAGDDVERLGKDAADTARKVDSAMDKIAASSKRSATQVDSSMDRAGGALDEFKDEARQSGTEAAASFSGGFDSITGFVQETLAAGLSSVGKVGMAAGIAAAAGIGFVVSAAQAATEKVDGIRTALLDLKTEGLDDTAGRIKAVVDEMKETGTLERFASAAQEAGVDFGEYVAALAEGGPKAQAMKERLEEMTGAYAGFATIAGDGKAAHDLINRMGDQERAAAGASVEFDALSAATRDLEAATPPLADAVEAAGEALEGYVDPLGVYQEALATKEQKERDTAEATAKATKDAGDSWEDYVDDVDVSISEYNTALAKQVTDMETWAGNLGTLAKRGVDEGVLEELARMGPEGAALVAGLTKASDTELAKTVALFKRKGAASSANLAQGISDGAGGVTGAAAGLRTGVAGALSPPVPLWVQLKAPNPGAVSAIRRDVQNNLRPVEIPVMLKNVPTSTWSRFIP